MLARADGKHLDHVKVSIRPEGCRLAEEGRYFGTVERVIYSGEYQEVSVRLPSQSETDVPMVIYVPIEQDIQVGQTVAFDISPELVALVE